MNNKQNNVLFMKEYLKYAVTFERYVCIWQNAMEDVNNQIREIYDERKQLQSTKDAASNAIDNLDSNLVVKYNAKKNQSKKYRNRAILSLIICVVVFIACFVFSFLGISSRESSEMISSQAQLILYSVFFACMIFVSSLIGPIFAVLFLYNLIKRRSLTKNSDNIAYERIQQEVELNSLKEETEKNYITNIETEELIRKKQEEIFDAFNKAKKDLEKLYSENVLPNKYRNFSAVTKLYEYLVTGRCNTIQGHGGIYDTFETEKIQIIQILYLQQINNTVNEIKQNQQLLYDELQHINRTLHKISLDIESIKKSNLQIAENSAIAATAAQQSSVANQYMAWHTWWNS